MKKLLLMSMLAVMSTMVSSEDIELYISDVVKQSAAKSKVLIIFDNSGSMRTVEEVNADFDPDETYDPEGPSHAYNDGAIYFNKGGADGTSAIPTSPSDARRFNIDINSCQTAVDILARKGTYTGRIREYSLKGNTGTWEELPDNNGLNIEVLDCEDDVILPRTDADGNEILDGDGNQIIGNPKNTTGLDEGYPADGLGDKKNPQYHDPDINSEAVKKVDWSGPLVTLYTAKYLRWFYGQSVDKVTKTRLQIAQNSITDVIDSTPSIEFGLEVFNYNDGDGVSNANGGRIAMGIREMTTTNKANLISIIDEVITAETWTPLCESVYEASRYFAGDAVDFGDDDKDIPSSYKANTPPADSSIIEANKYQSPFDECTNKAFVILVTDGEPTFDNGADSKIEALTSLMPTDSVDEDGDQVFELKKFTEESATIGGKYSDDNVSNSYLPALAGWMENYDINPKLEGVQTVSTHTIGFSSGADDAKGLLTETAKRGGGNYFQAKTGLQLTQALLGTLRNLEPSNDSLTSASVAANNFDRTETLNSVYYAMFDPQIGPRWQGNLKKYKVINGVQLGANNVAAIDEGSGHFSELVRSYWSSGVDGNKVAEGGVAEWFGKLTSTSQRTIYTDTGGAGSLTTFDYDTLKTAYTDAAGLATELNVPEDEVEDYVKWAMGENVDQVKVGNSTPNMRPDIFADPLHSKPLVVNYGDLGEGKSAIRIVIGTNAGALHMFEDSGNTVKESWAFMPTEFLKNIKPLRDNYSSADKVYGIDGQITSYFKDINGNGKVDGSDKIYIIFGLRRGGSSYYALDITSPDSAPVLKWHIDNTSDGFEHLGQTWSKPKIAFSKLNASGSGESAVANPVVIIGGGYDTNKDDGGVGDTDTRGRAVYMLDLADGDILWNMAPTGATTTFPGTDSIPSSIATLDSDGDGFTDRLYTGDTGGNVWRVDMPGDDKSKWTAFKLASLGSDTVGDNENDLRFFYEPSIVRTFISETIETEITDVEGETTQIVSHQEIPYDAVLLGSGDRSNPLGTDTDDTFFMIKDKYIKTQAFTAESTPKTPTAITKSDLYNYTDDPFGQTLTTQQREALEIAVSKKDGWYVDFTQSGEKSTAEAIVINGVAYFTSFTPPEFSGDLIDCKPPTGKSWLYAIDLALGTSVYNWKAEGDSDRDDRIYSPSERDFLGAPTLIVVPEIDEDGNAGDAVGNIIVGRKIIPDGFQLRTLRTYQYVKEEK